MKNYSISGTIGDPDKKEILRDAMKTYAEDLKNQLSCRILSGEPKSFVFRALYFFV